MARKNRDLFEILGARRGGAAPQGIVKRVQDIVSPSTSASRPAARAKRKPPASTHGLVLAAVGFGGLLIGFVAGRWSADPAAPVGGDLNVPARTSPDDYGHRPQRFGAEQRTEPLPSGQKLTESLSNWAWPLLPFPVPDSADGEREAFEDAKRLAGWLWDQGFSNVRLRKMRFKSGRECWVVVDYVDLPDDTTARDRLLALEAPDFAPDFAARLSEDSKPIPINR